MHLNIPAGDFAGFVFDLDGTLIDTMPLHYRAWSEAMKRAGLTTVLNEDLFYSFGGVPTHRVAQLFGEHYKLPLNADKVTVEKEALYLKLLPEVKPIKPVVDFLKRMAPTHPCAIATGGNPEIALPAIEAAGLTKYFKAVITPCDVPPGRGKPEPDMFLLAAERMGVPAKKCLAFEDAEPGMRAARAAGMQVVHVPSRH